MFGMVRILTTFATRMPVDNALLSCVSYSFIFNLHNNELGPVIHISLVMENPFSRLICCRALVCLTPFLVQLMLLVPCVIMVMSGLWAEVTPGKEGWRFVLTTHGELSVIIFGAMMMQVWFVHNWDTPQKVRRSKTWVDMPHISQNDDEALLYIRCTDVHRLHCDSYVSLY